MKLSRNFFVGMLVAIAVSIGLGIFLGDLSVPTPKIVQSGNTQVAEVDEIEVEPLEHNTWFMASIAPGSHLPSVLLEIQYAYESGITHFILEGPLPWSEQQDSILLQAIEGVTRIANDAEISLALNCNPPQSWLRENPDEESTTRFDGVAYASVGSEKWLADTQKHMAVLLTELKEDIDDRRITGIVLQGLENGQWTRSGAMDTSPSHGNAFRQWITERYSDIDALGLAWNIPDLTSYDVVELPVQIDDDTAQSVFYTPSTDGQAIDYSMFLSETVSAHILALASEIIADTHSDFEVFSTCPNVLEHAEPTSGNWGLKAIRKGSLSGTMTSLHSDYRQIGQHGYYGSPVFSGWQTLSIDETYTGIGFDPGTRGIEVPGTYIPGHISNLMTRNGVLSALSGTTWVIADRAGRGAFAHKSLWRQLESILAVRDGIHRKEPSASKRLAVVIDENSSFFINDAAAYSSIFKSLLNALTHSGIDFGWTTLDSLLSDQSVSAPVYLFPNLYSISPESRERLHAILSDQKATAVWLYAPGYIGEDVDVANISTLTGITTTERDPGAKAGSRFVFSGTWIVESEEYGVEQDIVPTFASADEYADPLARYRDDESISAAMKYLDDGWTSVAIFEPTLTSDLLRDLFYILEVPLDVSVITNNDVLIIYADSNNVMLYNAQDTIVNLDFETNRDITNVLNSKQGWTNSNAIAVELKAGETALLTQR